MDENRQFEINVIFEIMQYLVQYKIVIVIHP